MSISKKQAKVLQLGDQVTILGVGVGFIVEIGSNTAVVEHDGRHQRYHFKKLSARHVAQRLKQIQARDVAH